MDPLSGALDVFELTLTSSTRFEAAGPWGLAFDRHDHIKVGAVLAGACWMAAADGSVTRMTAGDCWLLAGGHGFSVSSNPDVTPVPQRARHARQLCGTSQPGPPATILARRGKAGAGDARMA